MSKIFICYRREDSEGYVGRLYDRLIARFPGRVFMDTADIPGGTDFSARILDVIRDSAVMLVVIGPRWLTLESEPGKLRLRARYDHVRREIVEGMRTSVRIIPVLLQGTRMPSAEELPRGIVSLSRLNAVEIRHGTFDQDFEKLVDNLAEILSMEEVKGSQDSPAPENAMVEVAAQRPRMSERVKKLANFILFGR